MIDSRTSRLLFALALGAPLTAACTKHITVDPRNVVEMTVRPYKGEGSFCPGSTFQIELVATMNDGTYCSNLDKRSGCLGNSKAIIDPKDVRVTATNATSLESPPYAWLPDPNPLETAATGLQLGGWVETKIEDKPMKTKFARAALKPVYSCMASTIIMPDAPLSAGANGVAGPDIDVYVTTLSTPYYPDAILARVEAPSLGTVKYVISPSSERSLVIASKGQSGGRGFTGVHGHDGSPGVSSSSVCGTGGPGGAGGNGGPGGHGGNGGPGGYVRVYLDAANAPALKSRVLVSSLGGDAGDGGSGGSGGSGGMGGSGGPSADGCTGTRGPNGPSGMSGPSGRPGYPGSDGPPPKFFVQPRATMFASERTKIHDIEAARGKGGSDAAPQSKVSATVEAKADSPDAETDKPASKKKKKSGH